MHTKSLLTLIVLMTALWGGFCLFNSRPIFTSRQVAPMCVDKKIASMIVETNAIADVLNYTTMPNTLVLFDIDNTLAAPKGDLGTDQYSYYLIEQKRKEGMNFEEALAVVLPTIFQIIENIKMYPLEEKTINVLEQLRTKKIPMFALTSRSIQLAQRTAVQLAQAGIKLQAPDGFAQELSFTIDAPALLKDNIVFCAKNDKGKILMYLLEHFNYHPDCVVYVDDKLSYVLSVEKECLNNHIRFIGIRYGFCDEHVKNFDPVRAQYEYEQLIGNINSKPVSVN